MILKTQDLTIALVLGSLNLGICFAHLSEKSEIVILGVVSAGIGEPLKPHQIVKMERRLSYYVEELSE